MIALAGPLHLLALVLVVSGIQKLLSPRPAAAAMRDAGLPIPLRGRPVTGVVLGAAETATGLAAIAVPHPAAVLWMGLFYLALAVFVVVLASRDGEAGCGCFGGSSTPPGIAHLVLDSGAAATAFVVAAVGVPDVVDVVREGALVSLSYIILLVTGAALLLVTPVLHSEVRAALRGPRTPRAFGPLR